MPTEKFQYIKDDGSSSHRNLLVTEAPKSTVMALDLTEVDEPTRALYEEAHVEYTAEKNEIIKKAVPTFKAWLEARYPGRGLNPPFKSFKVAGLRKFPD